MTCKQHTYDETGHCFECDAPEPSAGKSRYTAKRVIKEIGIPHLTELVRGDGYWYFVWNNRLYESHSVYIMRLCDLPIERWVEEGRQFAERMKEKESFMTGYKSGQVIKLA